MSDEYEVERIVGRCYSYGYIQYLIQWNGYSQEHNTWECTENLLGNYELVQDFIKAYKKENGNVKLGTKGRYLLRGVYDPDPRLPQKKKATQTPRNNKRILNTNSKQTPNIVSGKQSPTPPLLTTPSSTPPDLSLSTPSSSDLDETWWEAVPDSKKRLLVEEDKPLGGKRASKFSPATLAAINTPALPGCMSISQAVESEEELLVFQTSFESARTESLKQQHELVKNTDGVLAFNGVSPPVYVINEQDDAIFPDYFVYLNDLIINPDVKKPPPEFLSGCQCINRQCKSLCHENAAYGKTGRLKAAHQGAIYECNTACKCDATVCINRVVQRGRQMPLEIFKTKRKGWGVRAVTKIKKGTFVEQYLGEVICDKDGVGRGKIYDRIGISYLFNMDLDGDTKNVIDSYQCGNASHYLNHSCDPNLAVFGVFYDSIDPSFHRLAFFTKRDVAPGEELTFDYIGSNTDTTDTTIMSRRFPCYCEAANCRNYIHT
ncbi:hypothetical protein BC941DRAFT_443832 [Chlamydoabsidia padenii]|nr:hypothetical protein BC941DRAFT_443832 [Chlamydoabsidia padenii]